jgi:hypothetical protein
LVATLARSLQADMQAELRDLERAAAAGKKEAGRGLKTELRRQVSGAGLGQRLANSWRDRHYPNRKLDAASLVYTKAPQRVRRGHGDPEPARALPGDSDRERAEEGHRRQADQPKHFPGASLRAAAVRAAIERAVAPGRRWPSRLVQPQDR